MYFGLGALVILINLFLYNSIGSLGMAVFLFILYLTTALAFNPKKIVSWASAWILFLAAMMVWRANVFGQFILFAAVGVSVGIIDYLWLSKKSFLDGVEELVSLAVVLPLSYLKSLFSLKFERSRYPFGALLRGLAVGLPLVFVLIGLLGAADPVFSKMITDWNQDLGILFFRALISGIFAAVLTPYLNLKLFKIPEKYLKVELPFTTEVKVILGLVAAVLGTFLVVQWPYIFVNVAKETSLSTFGVATYSEYVRRGFVEFLLVCAIVYFVCWAGVLVKQKIWLWWLVMAEFMIFLASLFRRVWLYQSFHGFTPTRIYGAIFLIWIFGLVGILIVRFITKKNLLKWEVGLTMLLVAALPIINVENLSNKFDPPTVNGNVDYVSLAQYSSDSYDGWYSAYLYAKDVVNNRGYQDKMLLNREDRREINYAGIILQTIIGKDDQLRNKRLWQFNFADYQASQRWMKHVPDKETVSKLVNKQRFLLEKISNQPENERGFDVDISIGSPRF